VTETRDGHGESQEDCVVTLVE